MGQDKQWQVLLFGVLKVCFNCATRVAFGHLN